MTIGNLSWGTEIQDRLQCKDFEWYLQNIYPELFVPNDPRSVAHRGAIYNPAANSCIDTLGQSQAGAKIGLYACHAASGLRGSTQDFVLSRKNEIRLPISNFDICIDRANSDTLFIYDCHGGGGNQNWVYDEQTGKLAENEVGEGHGTLCLEVGGSDGNRSVCFICVRCLF